MQPRAERPRDTGLSCRGNASAISSRTRSNNRFSGGSLRPRWSAAALLAVPFVQPRGLVDGHPASSKLKLCEGFSKKIVEAVKANPELWKDTAIFITCDEGGGYYDSG